MTLEDWTEAYTSFAHLSLEPSVQVDTTDGYAPTIAEIIEFVDRAEANG